MFLKMIITIEGVTIYHVKINPKQAQPMRQRNG